MQSDLIRLSFANASFKGKNLPYGDFSKVFFRFYICLHSLLFLLDSRGLLSMHDIINIWFLTFTIICAPNPDEGARSWPGNKYKKNKVDRTFEVANGLCTKRCTPKKIAIEMEEMYCCGIHKTVHKLPHRVTPPLSYTLFPPFCLVSTVLLPSGWNFSPPLRKYLVDCHTQLICSWISFVDSWLPLSTYL